MYGGSTQFFRTSYTASKFQTYTNYKLSISLNIDKSRESREIIRFYIDYCNKASILK